LKLCNCCNRDAVQLLPKTPSQKKKKKTQVKKDADNAARGMTINSPPSSTFLANAFYRQDIESTSCDKTSPAHIDDDNPLSDEGDDCSHCPTPVTAISGCAHAFADSAAPVHLFSQLTDR